MSVSYPFRSPLISVEQTNHLPSMLRVGSNQRVPIPSHQNYDSGIPHSCDSTVFDHFTTSAFETIFFIRLVKPVRLVNELNALLIYKNYAKKTKFCIIFCPDGWIRTSRQLRGFMRVPRYHSGTSG